MRATTFETVRRGYDHYVTDVFEDDPNSPYGFHHRVLGFRTVVTHRHGELDCESRRLTMLLNIPDAFSSTARQQQLVLPGRHAGPRRRRDRTSLRLTHGATARSRSPPCRCAPARGRLRAPS
ncbi:MAG: hypothetical protein AAGK22_06390 [Acidobacteriota bacterium]